MLSKSKLFSVLVLAVFLLLVVCFTASLTHADGAAGQWPVSDPPPDETGGSGGDGDGDGGDGVMALITVATLLQVIL